ncbi:hypothetical protein ID852_19005 [Xenorhabdus sp. 42]|uniref:TcdA/TcdB catalytic glycosyltransferase domain-containing protein n=1 Tax=Xenorhabdus szentirmaii TaxID=290112 RepID=UPI0019BF6CDC|nr:TcdA/TcdB catalytic glycosyltransferase domain-containing protein [Xenorhabdus sp. 42]MBD2822726.1 hypothetical protein [Xenorhabdus sp. 42]
MYLKKFILKLEDEATLLKEINNTEPEKNNLLDIKVVMDTLKLLHSCIVNNFPESDIEDNGKYFIDIFHDLIEAIISNEEKIIISNLIIIDDFICRVRPLIEPRNFRSYRRKISTLIKNRISNLQEKKIIEKKIHFLWVGNIPTFYLKYIQLWSELNKDYKITLWLDFETLLAGYLYEDKIGKIKNNDISNKHCINIHKECFYFYRSQPYTNDTVISNYLKNKTLLIKRKEIIRKIKNSLLKTSSNNIFIRDFNDIIKKHNYIDEREIYNFEIFYRTNLAAASDIARILILKEEGGIYVDVDTIPKLNLKLKDNELFSRKEKKHFLYLEKLRTFKNHIILNELSHCGIIPKENWNDMSLMEENNITLISNIKNHMDKIDKKEIITGLGEVYLPFDLFLISRNKDKKKVFFSNIIATNKNSLFIKESLTLIKGNYKNIFDMLQKKYIANNEKIFFESYSLDGYKNDSCVTLNVSGPGALLNAAHACIVKYFELPICISQESTIELLSNHLSFTEQTIETVHSLKSSWML